MAEDFVTYDKYRADLADFRADMAAFREEVRGALQGMRLELAGIDTRIVQLEIRLVRWILTAAALGGLVGGLVAATAKLLA